MRPFTFVPIAAGNETGTWHSKSATRFTHGIATAAWLHTIDSRTASLPPFPSPPSPNHRLAPLCCHFLLCTSIGALYPPFPFQTLLPFAECLPYQQHVRSLCHILPLYITHSLCYHALKLSALRCPTNSPSPPFSLIPFCLHLQTLFLSSPHPFAHATCPANHKTNKLLPSGAFQTV